MKNTNRKIAAAVAAGLMLLATGCIDDNNGAVNADEDVSNRILTNYQKSQPVPEYPWSQLRENLSQIIDAQANTTVTTSFFFNVGVADPISSCPSIGFPIPSTAQMTSPEQRVGGQSGAVTVPQIEPSGVYTGDSTGTYVMCVDGNGNVYADYWEGFVKTVTGPAEWNTETKTVVLTGDPTGGFTQGK